MKFPTVFKRPPSVFLVAVATVLGYWSLTIFLGYRYYRLSGDWLKQSAELLLLLTQTIGIVVGAYWVMRTFGWEKRVLDIQKVADSLNEIKSALPGLISALRISQDENAYMTPLFQLTGRLQHRVIMSRLPEPLQEKISKTAFSVVLLAAEKTNTNLPMMAAKKGNELDDLIREVAKHRQ